MYLLSSSSESWTRKKQIVTIGMTQTGEKPAGETPPRFFLLKRALGQAACIAEPGTRRAAGVPIVRGCGKMVSCEKRWVRVGNYAKLKSLSNYYRSYNLIFYL